MATLLSPKRRLADVRRTTYFHPKLCKTSETFASRRPRATKRKEKSQGQMEQENVFLNYKAERIVNSVIDDFLLQVSKYDPASCPQQCLEVSARVRDEVKLMQSNQHRIIVSVTMGQSNSQSIMFASRCLWNESRDNFATVSRQEKEFFISISVFGIFKEWLIRKCVKLPEMFTKNYCASKQLLLLASWVRSVELNISSISI